MVLQSFQDYSIREREEKKKKKGKKCAEQGVPEEARTPLGSEGNCGPLIKSSTL